MFASPPEQTLEWNDAGVEGANRFLRAAVELRRQARADAIRAADARRRGAGRRCQGAAPRGAHRAAPGELRLRAHAVQHRGLRCDEAAQRARRLQGRRRRRVLREGFGILLRALYPACPHITWVLWQELGYAAAARRPARRALAAGRRGGAGAGRDRADAAGQRQAARRDPACAADADKHDHRGGRAGQPGLRTSSPRAGDRRR